MYKCFSPLVGGWTKTNKIINMYVIMMVITAGPYAGGCRGCRLTPPETAGIEILKNPGIDFYSGFRKNDQGGGVQIEILKNPGIDFYSGFRKNDQGGANRNPIKMQTFIVASGKLSRGGG